MCRNSTVRIVALIVAGLASVAVAQDRPREGRGPGSRGEGAFTRPAADRPGERVLERILKDHNLTAEQDKQVRQILETQRQAVQNWRKENLARIQELTKQKNSSDKDQASAAEKELQKIWESRKALHESLLKQLKEVLKPEQMEKVRQILDPSREDVREGLKDRPGLGLLAGLKALQLTDDQKAKVKEIFQDTQKKLQSAKDEKERQTLRQTAGEKIRSDVLTQEQRDRLAKIRQDGGKKRDFFLLLQQLKLTDEQKKQIQDIHEDAKVRMEKATTPKEKREIAEGTLKKIHDTVLTDEQRQQVDRWRKEHPRGGPGGSGGARVEGSGGDRRHGNREGRERPTSKPATEKDDEDAF